MIIYHTTTGKLSIEFVLPGIKLNIKRFPTKLLKLFYDSNIRHGRRRRRKTISRVTANSKRGILRLFLLAFGIFNDWC